MTWGDWLSSIYNLDNWQRGVGNKIYKEGSTPDDEVMVHNPSTMFYIKTSDTIINNQRYIAMAEISPEPPGPVPF